MPRNPFQTYLATIHCSLTCAGASGSGFVQPLGVSRSQTALARALPPARCRYLSISGDQRSSHKALSLENSAPSLRWIVAQSTQSAQPTAMDTHSTSGAPHSAQTGLSATKSCSKGPFCASAGTFGLAAADRWGAAASFVLRRRAEIHLMSSSSFSAWRARRWPSGFTTPKAKAPASTPAVVAPPAWVPRAMVQPRRSQTLRSSAVVESAESSTT